MSKELTGLQQQLLTALVESGLSKDSLLSACEALYDKQKEITESAVSASASEVEQGDELKPCSAPQHTSPGKRDAVKIEEAPKRMMTMETRLEAEQQMNFLDHMLRYV